MTSPPREPPAVQNNTAMRIVVAHSAADLAPHIAAWDALAASAIEPNVFYESWHLLPALRRFGSECDLRFVLIYRPDEEHVEPFLCGFFPLERHKRCKGLPVEVLSLWNHLYSSLCTPLVRQGYENECLKAFFAWLKQAPGGAPLLQMTDVPTDGPFHRYWVDWSHQSAALIFTEECHTRALLRPADCGETYLRTSLSGRRRKELKRKSNRLAEVGHVEFSCLDVAEALPQWTEAFLKLEASGWKGREGTAFACNEAHRSFFSEVVSGAFARGRLMLLALNLNGQPIAMKFNLLAESGAFACKIAFDEDFAHYSPGVLLEMENIRRAHLTPGMQWMDSCAIPDHSMINRLWKERRIVHSQIVSSGRKPGDLVVSLLPLVRWLNRKLRKKAQKGPQIPHEQLGEEP